MLLRKSLGSLSSWIQRASNIICRLNTSKPKQISLLSDIIDLDIVFLADVFTENPDEKSIITYVVAFYHYFSKMKALAVEGKRVGKVHNLSVYTSLSVSVYTCFIQEELKF